MEYVYVLEKSEPYEHSQMMGVYKTLEGAKKAAIDYVDGSFTNYKEGTCKFYEYSLEDEWNDIIGVLKIKLEE